jgi:hypothetical protein
VLHVAPISPTKKITWVILSEKDTDAKIKKVIKTMINDQLEINRHTKTKMIVEETIR